MVALPRHYAIRVGRGCNKHRLAECGRDPTAGVQERAPVKTQGALDLLPDAAQHCDRIGENLA